MSKNKKVQIVLLFLFTAVTLGYQAFHSDPAYADASWQATYWNNTLLEGAPVLQRPEAVLINDWGLQSPAPGIVNGDYFSARWTRTVDLSPGRYRFIATADDGIRVWVNGVLIIDGWKDQPKTVYIGYADVTDGSADVKVEYYDEQHQAVAQLTWTKIWGSGPLLSDTAVPASNSTASVYETPVTNWKGEYFNNAYLIGEPVLVRDDAAVDFNWGLNTPDPQYIDFDREHFSARWTQTANLPAGRYRFIVTVDDGVRLWVNNQLLMDQWGHHAGATFAAEIDLPGGDVPIKVEYYDDVGLAEIHLSWSQIDGESTSDAAVIYHLTQ
ncbi:MAG: hypothetical protein H6669_16970 [Ardenticatenaceae bacterium]|nr:hypothetical protein [Ardenticatenaceae bacterium]